MPPGPLGERVASLLRDSLERRQWSQRDFERRCGISQSQLSRILSGERSPSLAQFEAMCIPLGLRMVDVIMQAQVEVAAAPPRPLPPGIARDVERAHRALAGE